VLCLQYIISLDQSRGFHELTARVRTHTSALAAWVSLMQLLTYIYKEEYKTLVIGALGLCGCGVVALSCLLTTSMDGLSAKPESSDVESVATCCALLNLHQKSSKEGSTGLFVLAGYFWLHYEICKKPYCPISRLLEQGQTNPRTHRNEILTTVLSSVNRMMKGVLSKHPRTVAGRVFYVSFLLNVTKNYILAWEVAQTTKLCDLSFVEAFIFYAYRYVEVRAVARDSHTSPSWPVPGLPQASSLWR
jgi:hypothetical protein